MAQVPVRGRPARAAEAGRADPERAARAVAAQGQGERRPGAQPRRRVAHEAGQSLLQQQDTIPDTR